MPSLDDRGAEGNAARCALISHLMGLCKKNHKIINYHKKGHFFHRFAYSTTPSKALPVASDISKSAYAARENID